MEIGQIFENKYRVLGILGKGGMSTVYLVENIKLGTLWAVKEIKRSMSDKFNILAEPNILKKLNHPALPRIFDIVENEENVCIVVDYIDGTTLDNLVTKDGPFAEKTVIEWSKQICNVLIYLHGITPNPIIFRDMKPSNIMLAKDGSIKLIDFGIAREFNTNSGSDTVYIGTRGYAAPEQYGAGQTNQLTDVYSFGVTIYTLLTGKKPDEYPYEIKPVRYFQKNLSEDIEKIINKCTRQNPEERYESVKHLLSDIVLLSNEKVKKRIPLRRKFLKASGGPQIEAVGAACKEEQLPGRTKVVSFKKLVLAVWGNAEFACELAYAAAKFSGLGVLLINLDFVSLKAGMYLNMGATIEKEYGKTIGANSFKSFIEGSDNKDDNKNLNYDKVHNTDALYNSVVKMKGLKNLHLLMEPFTLENYEYYYGLNIGELIGQSYSRYDITVVILNKSILDPLVPAVLRIADHCILPLNANLDTIIEYQSYILHLGQKQGVPNDKFRFIAYEYKKGINLSIDYLNNVFKKENILGTVSYQTQRERYRNINSFYAKWACKKCAGEYRDILSKLNIVSKRSIVEKLFGVV